MRRFRAGILGRPVNLQLLLFAVGNERESRKREERRVKMSMPITGATRDTCTTKTRCDAAGKKPAAVIK